MKRWIHAASRAINPLLRELAAEAQESIEYQIDDPIEFGEVKFDRDGFSFRVIDRDQGYWDGTFRFDVPIEGDIFDQLEETVSWFLEDLDVDI